MFRKSFMKPPLVDPPRETIKFAPPKTNNSNLKMKKKQSSTTITIYYKSSTFECLVGVYSSVGFPIIWVRFQELPELQAFGEIIPSPNRCRMLTIQNNIWREKESFWNPLNQVLTVSWISIWNSWHAEMGCLMNLRSAEYGEDYLQRMLLMSLGLTWSDDLSPKIDNHPLQTKSSLSVEYNIQESSSQTTKRMGLPTCFEGLQTLGTTAVFFCSPSRLRLPIRRLRRCLQAKDWKRQGWE